MSDCIRWEGRMTWMGYGANGRELAHRYVWEQKHGKIPTGMVVHHDCGNKWCVNLEHLRCITHAEHNREHLNATPHYERLRAITHCPQGHEYNPENTMVKRGRRHCRECNRAYNRAYYAQRKEPVGA